MAEMRAVALTRYLPIEHSDALMDVMLPLPEPGPRDLRVRVEAVSVNPVDTKLRAPKPLVESTPKVLGFDAAGVVEAMGPLVRGFRLGDAVFYAGSIARPGSNAEFQLVDERIVAHKPASLSYAQAAALPLTAITAWELLFDRFGLDPEGQAGGRSLLVLGGGGGLGSLLIQLARRAGLVVIATASRAESRAQCLAQGADLVIDHRQALAPQLIELGYDGVDLIANLVDTDAYWEVCTALLNPQGQIGLVVGSKRALELEPLKSKSARVVWEYMFTRSLYGTPDMAEQGRLLARVAALVDAGELRSTLSETIHPINAANLRRAHAQLESGRTVGKWVLAGWPP